MVAVCSQVDAKQDNIYQKLYELTNKLYDEKKREKANTKALAGLHTVLKALSAELKARQIIAADAVRQADRSDCPPRKRHQGEGCSARKGGECSSEQRKTQHTTLAQDN